MVFLLYIYGQTRLHYPARLSARVISMDLFSPEKIIAYRRSKIITNDHVKQIDVFKTTSGKFTEHSIKRLLEGKVLTLDQVQNILKKNTSNGTRASVKI